MLYKYKIRIAILLFVMTFVLTGIIFGGAVCSDGWASRSIGSRGACSHHGGVSSMPAIVSFMAAILVVILFDSYVDGKYRKYKGYIVKKNLPCHPLERAPQEIPKFTLYEIPALSAQSRKNFQCASCGNVYQSGAVYNYVEQKTRNTKFCPDCSNLIPSKNKKAINEREFFFSKRKKDQEEVGIYYKNNSLAEVCSSEYHNR